MLKKAHEKSIYHQLIEDNIMHFIQHANNKYDLILSIDTFVYFGELNSIFSALFDRAQSNGYYAFSLELIDTISQESSIIADYQLSPTGRSRHALSYVRRISKKKRLAVGKYDYC